MKMKTSLIHAQLLTLPAAYPLPVHRPVAIFLGTVQIGQSKAWDWMEAYSFQFL